MISSSPCVRSLVSASTADTSESAEPGLDPEGEGTPDLFADMGLEAERGLELADDRGRTQDRLEAGRLAELGLL